MNIMTVLDTSDEPVTGTLSISVKKMTGSPSMSLKMSGLLQCGPPVNNEVRIQRNLDRVLKTYNCT